MADQHGGSRGGRAGGPARPLVVPRARTAAPHRCSTAGRPGWSIVGGLVIIASILAILFVIAGRGLAAVPRRRRPARRDARDRAARLPGAPARRRSASTSTARSRYALTRGRRRCSFTPAASGGRRSRRCPFPGSTGARVTAVAALRQGPLSSSALATAASSRSTVRFDVDVHGRRARR